MGPVHYTSVTRIADLAAWPRPHEAPPAGAGASPLEPYNGGTLVTMFRDRVSFTILCALDPYAVVGIREAWEMPVDLVAGPAANTEAGVELVRRLTGLEALNLMDRGSHPRLRTLLEDALGGTEPPDP